jgi:hypothetical protein
MNASRALAPFALLGILAAPQASFAEPVDPQKLAIAQTLYDQGLAALADKDYGTACSKLEEVTRILPNGIGGLLVLAHCYESAGRLASAWTTYSLADDLATRAARAADETEARTRAEALKPRLANLVIVVSPATGSLAGLSITRDGIPVGAAQWQTPVPVDKGEHRVVVTASGAKRREIIIDVPSDGESVAIPIPEPDLVAETPVARAPAPAGAIVLPPAPIAPSQRANRSSQRAVGTILMGAGGVALLAGAVAGALVIAQHGSLVPVCPGAQCPPSEQGNVDTYHAKSLVADIGFATGAVVLTTGLTLLLTAPGRAPDKPPAAHLGLGAFWVEGHF